MTQPNPIVNDGPSIHDLVMRDLPDHRLIPLFQERKQKGLETYGTILQAGNGRNAILDALEESLDHVVYLRQAIEQKEWSTIEELSELIDLYNSSLEMAKRLAVLYQRAKDRIEIRRFTREQLTE